MFILEISENIIKQTRKVKSPITPPSRDNHYCLLYILLNFFSNKDIHKHIT